jgi:hypothetical protein
MRYYEIAQRPTPTDHIGRDARHLQHDTEQFLVSGNAVKVESHSAAMVSRHAPVPHPGRYGRVL